MHKSEKMHTLKVYASKYIYKQLLFYPVLNVYDIDIVEEGHFSVHTISVYTVHCTVF